MGDLQVTRWRKYGKDRLYVNDVDGQRVGWVDLQSGGHALERSETAVDFRAAVADFCAAHGLPTPALSHASPGLPLARTAEPEPEPEPAWHDLSLNVPGQAARVQADAELAAMEASSRVGTFLVRAFDLKTDERAWRVGASGEKTIGTRLEKLRKRGWHVLHAVPVGERGSDIDHIVIGPGGVWTLNTKTHPGAQVWVGRHQVRVNGHRTTYLRNSRYEAQRATRLLTDACGFPVFVKAALVFLTGSLIPNVTIKQNPDGVAVLDRMDIPGAFRRTRRTLADDQVAAIFEQARRSTTWRHS